MNFSLLSPKKSCTFKATGWKMYPMSFNSKYFSILCALAPVAVVPGLINETRFRRLGARASTTVTSYTSCLPISQGIIEHHLGNCHQFGRVHAVRALKASFETPTSALWKKLRVAWREKRPALSVQERPCKQSRSTLTTVARMRYTYVGSET